MQRLAAAATGLVVFGLMSGQALAGGVDGISVSPNLNGLPGVSSGEKIVGGLMTYVILACAAGIAMSAAGWAFCHHFDNPKWQHRARGGLIGAAIGLVLVGGLTTFLSFFTNIGLHTNV